MREVFAHYMVGLTSAQGQEQWAKDIRDAKAAKIDGFALNIGPEDGWTAQQLDAAYAAAAAAGNFKMFISFDMNEIYVQKWTAAAVSRYVNEYKDKPAQFKVDGKPMVNTFEGPNWNKWDEVRGQTGGIYLVPNWSTIDASKVAGIDGAFNWGAWPKANKLHLDNGPDIDHKRMLGSKSYMMGISPWFFVNAPTWGKNWYSSSEGLWFDRWQQALELQPEFIQIITWNDFSESSYIADIVGPQVVPETSWYVNNFDHSAFRAILPYYIDAYKAGKKTIDVPGEDVAIAWYRPTPAGLGASPGTVWGQGGGAPAKNGARDVVSVISITVDDKEVQLSIGGQSETFRGNATSHVSYFEKSFGGLTGDVVLSMGGKSVTGPAISNSLARPNVVNFNPHAIRL